VAGRGREPCHRERWVAAKFFPQQRSEYLSSHTWQPFAAGLQVRAALADLKVLLP